MSTLRIESGSKTAVTYAVYDETQVINYNK